MSTVRVQPANLKEWSSAAATWTRTHGIVEEAGIEHGTLEERLVAAVLAADSR